MITNVYSPNTPVTATQRRKNQVKNRFLTIYQDFFPLKNTHFLKQKNYNNLTIKKLQTQFSTNPYLGDKKLRP